MATPGFMKLHGITNDDQFDVMFDSGLREIGRQAAIQPLHAFSITKKRDDYSLILFHKCADGGTILFGSVRLPAGKVLISFSNLHVTSISQGPDDDSTESVGFDFDKSSWEFIQ